ncbi:hypothetical protein [uncultured Akkermansia sp.]|uniref:hypothetical protein n=1 Tax=uncultured Akkermansia sp. TaxID=512294 RepID=UPI002639CA05|nr:hypothetical protein [uncultured Akkermansia sp.]
MNTEIVAQIIVEGLQERPEFAGVPVWEPTDGEKEGDKALMVNVTGSDEIISGNFTYQISGEIMYRQRYAEAEPAALVLDVTAFSRACAEVMTALAGRRNGQDAPAAWVVLGASSSPALAGTSETFMVYKCNYELFIQF